MSTPRSCPSSPGLHRKTLILFDMRPLPRSGSCGPGARAVILAYPVRYEFEDARVDFLERKAGVQQKVGRHGALDGPGEGGDGHAGVHVRPEDPLLLALLDDVLHLVQDLLLDLCLLYTSPSPRD